MGKKKRKILKAFINFFFFKKSSQRFCLVCLSFHDPHTEVFGCVTGEAVDCDVQDKRGFNPLYLQTSIPIFSSPQTSVMIARTERKREKKCLEETSQILIMLTSPSHMQPWEDSRPSWGCSALCGQAEKEGRNEKAKKCSLAGLGFP